MDMICQKNRSVLDCNDLDKEWNFTIVHQDVRLAEVIVVYHSYFLQYPPVIIFWLFVVGWLVIAFAPHRGRSERLGR